MVLQLVASQNQQQDPSADVAIFLSSKSVFSQLVAPSINPDKPDPKDGQWVSARDGTVYDVPIELASSDEKVKTGDSSEWAAGQYCIAGPCRVKERLTPRDDNAFIIYRVRDVEMRDLRKSFSGEELHGANKGGGGGGGPLGPNAASKPLSRNPTGEEASRPLEMVNLEFEDGAQVYAYKFPGIDTGLGQLKVSVKYRMDLEEFNVSMFYFDIGCVSWTFHSMLMLPLHLEGWVKQKSFQTTWVQSIQALALPPCTHP